MILSVKHSFFLAIISWFVSVIPMSLQAQNVTTSFEDGYMKCYEKAFADNGEAICGFLQKSEQFLIDRNVLRDTTGTSYVYFLNNSRSYIDTPYAKFGFINFMMGQLQSKNFSLDTFKACSNELKATNGYEKSKLFQVEETLKQIKTIKDVQKVTVQVATMLTEAEVSHPYYRLRIINFLESHGRRSTEKISKKPTLSKEALQNALKIHIKAQDEILVNTTSVSFGELLQKTKTYLEKNTSKSIITIKAEAAISKQFSTALQLEIKKILQSLRDQLSQKKYNSSFEKLSSAQQQEIKKTYPETIIFNQ
ncbi:MAG: hypothetical protein AAF617_10320 [Bacteroidota bacterium]